MKTLLLAMCLAFASAPAGAEAAQIPTDNGGKTGTALAVVGLSCVAGAALSAPKIDRVAGCGLGMAVGTVLIVGVNSALAEEAPADQDLPADQELVDDGE